MSREHPFALHRVLLIAVVLLLAAVAFLALSGPDWYKRAYYYPLRFEDEIEAASGAHGVDPHLIAAVIDVESGFEEGRVSEKGAVGLMQVMPETAAEVAVSTAPSDGSGADPEGSWDLVEPATNIDLGTAYLADLLARYEAEVIVEADPAGSSEEDLVVACALAGYNAGPAKADPWLDVALSEETSEEEAPSVSAFLEDVAFAQTRHYVQEVLEARAEYEQLYPDAFDETR